MAGDADQDPVLQELAKREIYLETQMRGPYAQVRAIDALTGVEVAVTTPAGAAKFDQRRLALRKLGQALIAEGALCHDVAKDAGRRNADKAGDHSNVSTPALPKRGIYT
jgi:hypothetical protein